MTVTTCNWQIMVWRPWQPVTDKACVVWWTWQPVTDILWFDEHDNLWLTNYGLKNMTSCNWVHGLMNIITCNQQSVCGVMNIATCNWQITCGMMNITTCNWQSMCGRSGSGVDSSTSATLWTSLQPDGVHLPVFHQHVRTRLLPGELTGLLPASLAEQEVIQTPTIWFIILAVMKPMPSCCSSGSDLLL